jgi:hypothetical protein
MAPATASDGSAARCTRGNARKRAFATSATFRSRSPGGTMTVDATDMSTPVTRGELKEELANFELRLEQKLEQKLEEKFDQKLELWGGALLFRIAASERMIAELGQRMLASEQRILAELARHCGAMQESLSKQISVIDEKYSDLPRRVRRLESKVFAPKRR